MSTNSEDMKKYLKVEKGQLTFDSEGIEQEGNKYHSRTPHVPGNHKEENRPSGVTIGRGYDVGKKTAAQIKDDFKYAYISDSVAEAYISCIGLNGARAERAIKEKNLPGITLPQQQKLFERTYSNYEKDARRICEKKDVVNKYGRTNWDNLNPRIKEIVVDLHFRGDYSPGNRKKIQSAIAKNDYNAFKSIIKKGALWNNVPPDRFNRRKDFLENNVAQRNQKALVNTTNDGNKASIFNSYSSIQQRYHGLNPISSLFTPYSRHYSGHSSSPFFNTMFGTSRFYSSPYSSSFSSNKSFADSHRYTSLLFRAMVGNLSYLDKMDINQLSYSNQKSVLDAFANHIKSKMSFSGYSGFSSILGSTGLKSSYNSLMGKLAVLNFLGGGGEIGGVATRVGELKGFKDSITHALHQEHIFAIKTTRGRVPFSDGELKQILRELAIGIYLHDTFPFFSLHFNEDGRLYPVIHPAYQNTLVGEVIGLLDDMLKGFLNGGVYNAEFLKNWHTTSNMDKTFLKEHVLDLQRYCRENLEGVQYISLREMMAREGLESPDQEISDNPNSIYKTKFKTSFRIISHIPEVREEDGVFVIDPDFDVEYSINLMPDYEAYLEKYLKEHGAYPKEYLSLKAVYEKMKKNIKEQMPKIPIFQEYFQMLGVICFSAYYLKTMKSTGMMPAFEKAPVVHPVVFPKALPPIPVRHYVFHKISLTMKAFATHCQAEELNSGFTGMRLNQILKEVIVQIIPEPSEQSINRINTSAKALVTKLLPTEIVSLGIDIEFLKECSNSILNFLVSFSLDYNGGIQEGAREILNKLFELAPNLGSLELFEQTSLQEKILYLKKLVHQFEQIQLTSSAPALPEDDLEKYRQMRDAAIDRDTKILHQNVIQTGLELQQAQQNIQVKLTQLAQVLNTYPAISVLNGQITTVQNNIAMLTQRLTQVPYKSPITDDELRVDLKNQIMQLPNHSQLDIPKTVESNLPGARVNATTMHQQTLALKSTLENDLKMLQGACQEIQNIQTDITELGVLLQECQTGITSLAQQEAQKKLVITAEIDRQILALKKEKCAKMIAKWNKTLDRCLHILEQPLEILLEQKSLDRNLVPTYRQSVLSIADGGYYRDVGDNFKVVGGCSVRLPNLQVHPLWQSDRILLLKASVLAPTLKNESFGTELLEHQGGKYAVFKMNAKETDGNLEDCMELMSSLEDPKTPRFEVPEFDTLSHLMLDDFDEIKTEFNSQSKDLSGRTMLDRVVESCSPKAAKFMMDKAPLLLSTPSKRGILPMYTAASTGNTEVVNLLLDKVPSQVNSTTQDDETPLMIASAGGHIKTIAVLISRGAAINHRLPSGLTALWKALQNRQEEAALVFIKTPGIDLSFVLDNGENVLHEAIKQCLPNAARALITSAALLQPRKSDGKTPWHLAADMGQTEILKAMLASGKILDINITTEGSTALHFSARNGHVDVIKLLNCQSTKIKLDLKDNQGRTALRLAIEGGHEEVALQLIKCGAGTASDLVCAAELKMFNVTDALVEKGVAVSSQENKDEADYGYYLLVYGEYHRYRQLLERSLLTDSKKYFGQSCVAIAAEGGHAALANYLYQQGGKYESLGNRALIHWMIIADDVGFLRKWLRTHQLTDGTIQNGSEAGKTLGYLATEHRSIRCLTLLKKYFTSTIVVQTPVPIVKAPAPVVQTPVPVVQTSAPVMVTNAWHGKHLLDAAVRSGDSKTIECLLLLIRDLNQKINSEGYNALTLSAELGHIHLIQQLPKWGANILQEDTSGRTAMHLGILHGDIQLLQAIANIVSPNLWPQDLWTTANVKANEKVVSWLVKNLEQTQKTIDSMKALIALQDAIRLGEGNRVQTLLKLVLDINQVVGGKTALAIATEMQQYNIIENLLAHGAKADVPSSAACALFVAAKMNNIYLIERFNASKAYATPIQEKSLQQIIEPIAKYNTYVQGALLGNFSQYHQDKEKLTLLIKDNKLKAYKEMINNNFPINCTRLKLWGNQAFIPFALIIYPRLRPFLMLSVEKLRIDSLDMHGGSVGDVLIQLEDEALKDIIPLLNKHFGDQLALMLKRNIASNNGFVMQVVHQRKELLLDLLEEKDLLINYSGPEGLTCLHVAVHSGNLPRISRLLDKKFPIDAPSQRGETPLMLAASLGNDLIVKMLLSKGADPNKVDREGKNAFHYALDAKKIVTSVLLMSRTRDLTATDRHGKTYLMYAVRAGLSSIVRLLLSIGVDPSVKDGDNYSALHYAAITGDAEIIRILLANMGSVSKEKEDNVSETPLQLGARFGHVEACCELLKSGADPIQKSLGGLSAIDWSFSTKRPELIALFQNTTGFYQEKSDLSMIRACCITDNEENLKRLCTLNVDVNALDQEGRNGLHFAALHNAILCTQILLSLNCSPNNSDHLEHETPLSIAAKLGHVGVIRTLLSYGAFSGDFNKQGNTPLLSAITGGHVGAVIELLHSNVDPKQPSKYGISPSVMSFTQPNVKIMQIVSLISGALPSSKELKSLPEYMVSKIQPQIKLLAEMHQAWNFSFQKGDTVLHLATRMCSVEAIHLLLNLEPGLIDKQNKNGETVRSIAKSLESSHPEVLASLLKHKSIGNETLFPEKFFTKSVAREVKYTGNGIEVETDVSTYSYQLISQRIPVSENSAVKISFKVDLKDGGFGIGLLSEDQQRWMVHKAYNAPGIVSDSIELPMGTTEKNLFLVFDNNSSTPATSRFTVQGVGMREALEREFELENWLVKESVVIKESVKQEVLFAYPLLTNVVREDVRQKPEDMKISNYK